MMHNEFDTALLDLYLDDFCGDEERAAVERHLAVCPDCRKYVEDWRRIRPAFAALGDERVPEGFEDRVLAAIRAGEERGETRETGDAGEAGETAKVVALPGTGKKRSWRRFALPVAACLVLALILPQLASFRLEGASGGNSASGAASPSAASAPAASPSASSSYVTAYSAAERDEAAEEAAPEEPKSAPAAVMSAGAADASESAAAEAEKEIPAETEEAAPAEAEEAMPAEAERMESVLMATVTSDSGAHAQSDAFRDSAASNDSPAADENAAAPASEAPVPDLTITQEEAAAAERGGWMLLYIDAAGSYYRLQEQDYRSLCKALGLGTADGLPERPVVLVLGED